MNKIKFVKIRQKFNSKKIENITQHIITEFSLTKSKITKDQKIAIAIGSRGITNLKVIIKTLINEIKSAGGAPFIVPSMGSHGGATAHGQTMILEELGITEEIGAPILSSMEVYDISKDKNIHCYIDKIAYNSDGIILVNRIKPHTDFKSKYESGLMKMATIGLGNHKGAQFVHKHGIHGLTSFIPTIGEQIINSGKIFCGVAIIENELDESKIIIILPPASIIQEEPKLLEIAKNSMPRLPLDRIDILMIKEMGKNISGTGIDTNIIGRVKIKNVPDHPSPVIKNIIVEDLTSESHGNALGVGLADFITSKLHSKIDFKTMEANIKTTTFTQRGVIPLIKTNVLTAYNQALERLPTGPDIIYIKNTLALEELFISINSLSKINTEYEIINEYESIFKNGDLI